MHCFQLQMLLLLLPHCQQELLLMAWRAQQGAQL
jgi:hypothetical protein